MDSVSLAQWATYISFLFVIIAYTIKVRKVVKMPLHLRWELYPVVHEKGYKHGGSYYEETDWWTKPRRKSRWRAFFDLFKRYLYFGKYFQKDKNYWFGLFPWHIGFYMIVLFHGLALFGALATMLGAPVTSGSASGLGLTLYWATIIVGLTSFTTGSIGSIVLLLKRLIDPDLKAYASPINYINYIFFFFVFISGFLAWTIADPTYAEYREFWRGLITFEYVSVGALTFTHIMLFSLFLIYLPFTRSTHYITKIIGAFKVRWDDTPYRAGGEMDQEIKKLLDQPVSWSAPHIQTGKKWSEIAQGMPEETNATTASKE